MKVVRVSRLLNFTKEDFILRLKSPVSVEYDDGVTLAHSAHELALNRAIYDLAFDFPDIGVNSSYSIHNYYVGGRSVASSLNKSFEAILNDIVDTYVARTGSRVCLEHAYEKMYIILEFVYNNIVCDNIQYVESLNILDFLQIQMKKPLMDAIDKVRVNRDVNSIKEAYDVLDTVIRESPDLASNPIAKGYISKTISPNQIKQLLGPRGFVSEIDGSIYKYPIASSFVLGMESIYDMAVESRSGAKALYISNRAISMAEYFAREMQLVTMSVEQLVDADCGNTEYIEWVVEEKDFDNLLGKHYFEGNEELVIHTGVRDKLVGTTIRIRSLSRCRLSNPKQVCSACFGRLSNNVPLHFNIGHVSITTVTAKITSKLLGTKHLTQSAASDSIVIPDDMKEFFIVKNRSTLAFRANSITKKRLKYQLRIPQSEGFGLASIHNSVDVNRLNLTRVSRLNVIYLTIENEDGSIREVPLVIKQGARSGNLTYAFLRYVSDRGYQLDSADRFVIDLDGWKTGIPLISLPQVEFNYVDLAREIKNEFKYMKSDVGTPEAFLHRLFNLINSRLDVNIALLEIVVYAFTVRCEATGDFRLGRNVDTAVPTKISNIITNRSVGGAYAWEQGLKTLLSPHSFYGYNAIDHPLDVLLKPAETLADYSSR